MLVCFESVAICFAERFQSTLHLSRRIMVVLEFFVLRNHVLRELKNNLYYLYREFTLHVMTCSPTSKFTIV